MTRPPDAGAAPAGARKRAAPAITCPAAAAGEGGAPAFLGVERSARGLRWIGPDAGQDRAADRIAQIAALPHPVAQVLARCGVAPEGAAAFLAPRLRDLLPDPRSLRDMQRAAARLLAAMRDGERIAVFADYDVDGGSAAALILTWLRALGRTATLYVPDRIDEGYGPNPPAMRRLAAAHDLILCVDCGTLSHAAIAAAAGADVVVLDHHLGGDVLPPALAVVNPNRADEPGDLGHLCAAAVVFLMLVEANRQLRDSGGDGPDLLDMLDLVALATVADVAPLTGVNRALVRQGLAVMAARRRPGLAALADAAGLAGPPDARALGYVLGPRVNAGGRVGRADLGARLLATDDPAEAAALAARLEALNAERRGIEAAVRAEALAQAEARGSDGPLVWAAGAGWHPGVVGIVAARLKEATGRPAVVIGLDGPVGKGSGRSVPGVDLGAAVQRLAAEGLLLAGGGHRMAAGLTVAATAIEPAMARLAELVARQGGSTTARTLLRLDALVTPEAATPALAAQIEAAGPYGAGAPVPRFALPSVRVAQTQRMGTGHLRLRLAGGLEAVAFDVAGTPLAELLEGHGGARLHLAGRLERDRWQGRDRVRLCLDDAART